MKQKLIMTNVNEHLHDNDDNHKQPILLCSQIVIFIIQVILDYNINIRNVVKALNIL
jgi:hypothetical protein